MSSFQEKTDEKYEKYEKYKSFLIKNKATTNNNLIITYSLNKGLGLTTKNKNSQVNIYDNYIEVPNSLISCSCYNKLRPLLRLFNLIHNIQQNTSSKDCLSLFPLSIQQTISFFFEVLLGEQSFYYDYISMIDMKKKSFITNKSFFKERLFDCKGFYREVYDMYFFLRSSFKTVNFIFGLFLKYGYIKQSTCEVDVSSYIKRYFLYKNIYFHIESRQFIIDYCNYQSSLLIPLADSLNHSSCSKVDYVFYDYNTNTSYGEELFMTSESEETNFKLDVKRVCYDLKLEYFRKFKKIDEVSSKIISKVLVINRRSKKRRIEIIEKKDFILSDLIRFFNNENNFFCIRNLNSKVEVSEECKEIEVFNNYGDYSKEHYLKYYLFFPITNVNDDYDYVDISICIRVDLNIVNKIEKVLKDNIIYKSISNRSHTDNDKYNKYNISIKFSISHKEISLNLLVLSNILAKNKENDSKYVLNIYKRLLLDYMKRCEYERIYNISVQYLKVSSFEGEDLYREVCKYNIFQIDLLNKHIQMIDSIE